MVPFFYLHAVYHGVDFFLFKTWVGGFCETGQQVVEGRASQQCLEDGVYVAIVAFVY